MKTVPLSRQYVVGSAVFDELLFRTPKTADYIALGKVADFQQGVFVTFDDVIWKYANRLIEGQSSGVIGELDLPDGLAVERAMIGFFTEATRQFNARVSSSSASDGGRQTSPT